MAFNPLFVDFQMNVVDELENAQNQRILMVKYRNIRDASNPFELPVEKFIKLFRLQKDVALILIDELQALVPERRRSHAIPFHLEVLASLLFYGHGGYQVTVGDDINLGISQPSMSRIINKISNLITILLPRYVKFPTTAEEIMRVKEGFYVDHQFPNVIGAIDGSQISIFPPKVDDPVNPAVAYLNRKGFHSINIQAIFDAKLFLLNINARYPGATHDSAIWETSSIQRHLKNKYREERRNCYLLGDSGYPIQPWLLTPIHDAKPNTPEGRYNELHIRTRNVAERGFGVLKGRFRCLKKDRVLHYSHGTAGRIIYSCAVLHNLCRKYSIDNPNEDSSDDEDINEVPNWNENINHDIDVLTAGRFVRRMVVREIYENA